MKIVHMITRLIRGGADENTLLSCNAQARSGHEVYLIYGSEVNLAMVRRLDPEVAQYPLAELVRPISPMRDIRAIFSMVRLLRSIRPDIVHTHTSKAGVLGRVAARIAGVKGVVHGVHILPFINVSPIERAVYLTAERLLANGTRAFVNVSKGMLEAGIDHRVGRGDQHYVVPSGMDVASFRGASPISDSELAETLNIPTATVPERRFVVMVAALEPRKRVVEFLEVFRDVLDTAPGAHLLVLGEGHDRSRIEQRIAALGLSSRVHLLGYRSDVQAWIARSDVCVLSSEREGLPRVIVQYALAGKPIVTTSLPGVEAIVEQGETGYLAPVNNLHAMTAPLSRVLLDQDHARILSENIRRRDLSRWSVEFMVSELDRIYEIVSPKHT